jgi:acetyltransferase
MHYLSPIFAPKHLVFLGKPSPNQPNETLWHNLDILKQPHVNKPNSLFWPKAELAILTTPSETWKEWFIACSNHGICHILIVKHFDELLPDDSMKKDLVILAKSLNIRILGPNVIGLLRPVLGINASYYQGCVKAGSLALVSQSSALSTAMLDWAHSKSIGFSSVIVLGDTLDVDMPEVFDFLWVDTHTQAVLLHVDHIQEGRKWLTALRRLSRTKPVIVLTSGNISEPRLFDAILARTGVLRVDHLAQLFTAARILAANYRVHGEYLAIISNGLGTSWLAYQAVQEAKIPLARLSPNTQEALKKLVPHSSLHENPIDLLGHATAECFTTAVDLCAKDEHVDAILVVFTPQWGTNHLKTAEQLCQLQEKHPRTPFLLVWMGGEHVAESSLFLARKKAAYFHAPEFAIDVFKQLVKFRQHQKMLLELPSTKERNIHKIHTESHRESIHNLLKNKQAKLSDSLAYEIMTEHVPLLKHHKKDQPQGKVSLAIVLCHDPCFGRYINLHARGPEECLLPIITLLPPLNHLLIQPYLAEHLWNSWFNAHFGLKKNTVQHTLEEILLDFSQMICDIPELWRGNIHLSWHDAWYIETIDFQLKPINPSSKMKYQHLAIMPYPKHLERYALLKDQTQVFIRPIKAEDAQAHQNFVQNLSEESRFNRYLSKIKKLPHQLLVRFTQIDYDGEMALVMCHDQEWLGIARYTRIFDKTNQGEFSLEIADAWQGKGVGTLLMTALLDAAKKQGIEHIIGDVLSMNQSMIYLMNKLGFAIQPHPHDASLVQVSIDLEHMTSRN